MQIKRTCKQCGTPLDNDKKLGAKYCNHSCQQGYYKRKVRILEQIKKLEGELEFNKQWRAENVTKIQVINQSKVDLSGIQKNINLLIKKQATLQKLLTSSPDVFRKSLELYLDRNMTSLSDDYGYLKFGTPKEQAFILKKHYTRFENMNRDNDKQLIQLENELEKNKTTNQKLNVESLNLTLKNFEIVQQSKEVENKLVELQAIDLENLPIKPNPKRQAKAGKHIKIKPISNGVTGEQILKMKFNNLELDGALGEFLGLVQRNKCAIALTGDSGAGKTTFSFSLARSFKDAGQRVGYFSLESGITETTQAIIDQLNLVGPKFKVFEEGDLQDVRFRADSLDCIIVDSYAKISSKAEDFENLRQDFPNTFFIIIFQKTTDGKIRGGSSILFNSTATIDIRLTKGNHRIAFMQKSRYGTENFVYSISLDQVLKNNKTPIKWSEIEENWPSPHHH